MIARHLLPFALLLLTVGCEAPARPVAESSTQPAGEELRLQGRVNDAAGVLDVAVEQRLTAQLQALEAATGHQMVVVTTPSLGGEEISRYSLALGRRWGIGRREQNDGVIVLLAPAERKVRIEVGSGLEKTLTDPLCKEIIEHDMLPLFKQDDMAGGLERGVASLTAKLT